MNELFFDDFDLILSEMILAHQSVFRKNSVNSYYNRGRKNSGVVYCLSGCADFCLQDSTFRLNPGELVFIPEGTAYSVCCPEEFHHITVNFQLFPSSFTDRLLRIWPDRAGNMVVMDLDSAGELLYRIVRNWNEKHTGFCVQVKSLMYDLLYRYFTALRKQSRTPEYGKLRPAKKILDNQYCEDISVAELAAACGFSQTHFRRLFSREFHCSPVEYRIEKRLLKAKDLLLAGEKPVCQISAESGFSDANYFSRIFKQRFGVPPTSYANHKM